MVENDQKTALEGRWMSFFPNEKVPQVQNKVCDEFDEFKDGDE